MSAGKEYSAVRLALPDLDALKLIREALASKLTLLNNLALGVSPRARRPDLSSKASAIAAVLKIIDSKLEEFNGTA
jgi:hypothetical protein